ncbi:MAG: FtsX-like permease family protein [Actinobacteria bacterium]|nr:FtsX-like permease family protein [Actinomycetota bacterium]
MKQLRFWLRWSARDLRRRWLQVLATAGVIAIGVAVYAGLGGMREFREQSAARSFEALKFHDLRVTLPDGSFAKSGEIESAARASGPELKRALVAQERLLVPTQIDGRPAGKDILTPGLLIGLPVSGETAGKVDTVRAIRGKGMPSDPTSRNAVIDRSYANFYDLPYEGELKLAGGATIEYAGQGQSPQYFLITSDTGFGGESTLGVLYAPLPLVQGYAGRAGAVNELVVGLAEGDDPAVAKRSLERSLAKSLPGATVTLGTEEQSHTIMFRDAKNDQRMMGFFGLLVLLGASIGAFNLVGRAVEAERREIGIGMALGVSPSRLALRPLLLGGQIALTGTLLGAFLSWWIAGAFAGVFEQFMPLPFYADPFSAGQFLRGAAVGFLLPFAATVWPVWRGVRVQPVEAIRVSERSARGGMVRAATRIKLPGGAVSQMPWRNSSRTPRRTMLAVVGMGAVIGVMMALLGIVDGFNKTIEESRAQLIGDAPGRLSVALAEPLPVDSPQVAALSREKGVASIDAKLDLSGTLASEGHDPFPVVMTIADLAGGAWSPTLESGRLPKTGREVAIAPKAADDLGVSVGDSVVFTTAGRDSSGRPTEARMPMRVTGLVADPFRVFAYAPPVLADDLGLSGETNSLSVMPQPGARGSAVQRSLAENSIVATTRPVTADSDALDDTMDQFKGIIQVAAGAALVLAVLMAFNLAGISLEERRREYATMFAFGLPVRRALRIAAAENLIVGALGTLLGLLIGYLAIGWMIAELFADTWPEIGIIRHISPGSLLIAVLVGVAAVTLTPYLMSRRLTRMDVPSTLRVVE